MKDINSYIEENNVKLLKEEEYYNINGGWKAAFSFAVSIGNFAVGVYNGWKKEKKEKKPTPKSNVYLRNNIS